MIDEDMERKVVEYLLNVGISPTYLGYIYLRELLMLYLELPDTRSYGLNSFGYNKVAEKFGVSLISVRQCIRSAIQNINTSKILFQKLFNVVWLSEKKITNSFFIYISINELKHGNIKIL